MKIALVGYARTGKDLVGEMIIQHLKDKGHGKTKRLAFGDELKERFFEAFPEAYQDKKPRKWFEDFGELGRQIEPNIWINAVSGKIKYFDNYNNFVVTDCRQPNEAKFLKENGFVLVTVWSPSKVRQKRSKDDAEWQPVNHSERFLHEIETDYAIMNDSDIEDLQRQVDYIMEEIVNGN